MLDLKVACLDGSQLENALPLVRLIAPCLTAREWRAQVAVMIGSGGGVLAVSAEDGLIYGVALFHPRKMLRLGKVLQVDDIITMEISRKAPVHRLLVETLAGLAETLDCHSLAMPVRAVDLRAAA